VSRPALDCPAYDDLALELIDRETGVLLDALEQTSQAENTFVIYTTDHGEMGGSHGLVNKSMAMYEEGFGPSSPGYMDLVGRYNAIKAKQARGEELLAQEAHDLSRGVR
jgi:predicted AlkP superfamily pyrophosphatase or phosphodiesterase